MTVPTGPLVGVEVILDRVGGNREILPRLVKVAIESIADSPARLRAAVASGDREAMAFHAHYAKGTAGYLELPWLHALARGAEESASAGAADAAERLEALALALERLIADLRRLGESLGVDGV